MSIFRKRAPRRLAVERLEGRLLLAGLAVEFEIDDYLTGDEPYRCVTGDFNADGRPDIVVANSGSAAIEFTLLVGRDGGGFDYRFFGPEDGDYVPFDMATGDFNADGRPDLAVTLPLEGRVSVYPGVDTVGFTSTHQDIYVGGVPSDVAVGDFNDDDRIDFAVTNATTNEVNILYSTIGGGFLSLDVPVGLAPAGIASADFNGDGRDDFVVTSTASDAVNVFMQRADGGFDRTNYTVDDYPVDVAVADFDGDLRLDLAVSNAGDDSVTILYGQAAGGFGGREDCDVDVGAGQLAVADFNKDSLPDVAVLNDDVSILYGLAAGGFQREDYAVGDTPRGIATADFENDTLPDLVVVNTGDDGVSVLTNRNLPPELDLTAPAVDVSVTRGDVVAISWTDDDPTANAAISFAYDPDDSATPWSDADHTWIVLDVEEDPDGAGDTLNWDTAGVAPGTYTVWAVIDNGVADPVYSRAAGRVTIEPDPSVSIDLQSGSDTGFSDTDNITSDNTPTYDVTVNVAGTIEIDWDGDGTMDVTDPVAGAGVYSYTAPVLPDDLYPVEVTFTDALLNVATDSNPTAVDTAAPAAPGAPDLQPGSDSGLASDDDLTNAAALTFDVASTDTFFRFYRDATQLGDLYEAGDSFTAGAETEGDWTYTVVAVDAAGNASGFSPGLDVTIDRTAPAAPDIPDLQAGSDSGEDDADNLTNDDTPTFDLSGFAPYYRLHRDFSQVSGSYEDAPTFTDGGMADGVHLYELFAVDAAGNVSASAGLLAVTVDTLGPTVDAVTPSGIVFPGEDHLFVTFFDIRPLWAATVADAANYTLLDSGGDGTFGDGNETDLSAMIAGVTYDAGTMTADIALTAGLPIEHYRLVVSGTTTVRDAAGNALDGDGDGTPGGDHGHDFEAAPYVPVGTIPGGGTSIVYVYDFEAPLDVRLEDLTVKAGKGDTISSIRIGARDSGAMAGLGLMIYADAVGNITDARRDAPGDVALIYSVAAVKGIKLKTGMTGYDINGLTLGSTVFAADVDGDGATDDATAILVNGYLPKALLAGAVTGDVLVLGADAKGTAVKSFVTKNGGFHADLVADGDVGKIQFGGDFGSTVHVLGALKSLAVKGGDLNGEVLVDDYAGKIAVNSARNRTTKQLEGGAIGPAATITIDGLDARKGVSAKSVSTKGDFAGTLTTAGSLGKLNVKGGDMTGTLDVGDELKTVCVTAQKGVGGGILGADVSVANLLKTLKAAGAFTDSDVDAGALGKVAVKGIISQTGGLHAIHAAAGPFAIQDATWKGTIEAALDHFFAGLRAYVG